MSQKYSGGFITKSPVAPTTSAASGIWTLDQQMQAQKAGTWPSTPNYIEDVFSTYLYTGTGAAQTITNGIDLSTKGGLVWSKARSVIQDHSLIDTVRGNGSILYSNLTSAADTGVTTGVTAFNTTGYALGSGSFINQNTQTYVSWTFREQPKFFDIVTWSGNDASNRQIAHNLGSVPGCIIVKTTGSETDWSVYHRSLGNTKGLYLNLTQAQETNTNWGNTTPTSSVFTTNLNGAGNTYIAYLFAHDAGGFGLAGTDNVISCGSYITDGSGNATVSLGYEPQWILVKVTNGGGGSWILVDNMRGLNANSGDQFLRPNTSAAETALGFFKINATGFTFANGGGNPDATYIYIAIRRGPMKTPTVGTSVFSTSISSSTTGVITSGFVTDMAFTLDRTTGTAPYNRAVVSRLRGNFLNLSTATTGLDITNTSTVSFQQNNGIYLNGGGVYANGYVYEQFSRAPGFMDEVCYTGTGVARTVTHNLTVVPELMIVKSRSAAVSWTIYTTTLGNQYVLYLNSTDGSNGPYTIWNNTTPTSSVFSVGASQNVNGSGDTYVAYLFATLAGVSKVGTYTGTGTTQTINCGFTAGSRFVMIKRTDSTGSWYVWDSARGIIPSNDPYLLLNTTAAEVTGTDYIDTTNVGFDITSTAPADINASGGTYIFLAIA